MGLRADRSQVRCSSRSIRVVTFGTLSGRARRRLVASSQIWYCTRSRSEIVSVYSRDAFSNSSYAHRLWSDPVCRVLVPERTLGAESRAYSVRGHSEDVPDFDREGPLLDLTAGFPFAGGVRAVFTAGNRISTRRPRAAAILRSIARL